MSAYEMQLRYVIPDKIQSQTKSENFFLTIFFLFVRKNFFSEKEKLFGKKILGFFLGFQVHCF